MVSSPRDNERVKCIMFSIRNFLWLYDQNHKTKLYKQFETLSIKWKYDETLEKLSLFIQENIPQTPDDQITLLIYAELFSIDVQTIYQMFKNTVSSESDNV